MTCKGWLWLLASIFLILATSFTSATSQYEAHVCLNNGNYSSESLYRANLNTLLRSLSSKMNGTGFYSATEGRANAIALCRGDIQPSECRNLVDVVAGEIVQLCPNQLQAIRWTEYCMVRYSNDSIIGTMAINVTPRILLWNNGNVTNPQRFKEARESLMDDLRRQAADDGDLRKAAAGNLSGPDFQTIYALVQCTPDLSPEDCDSCLVQAAGYIPGCCDDSLGVRVYTASCTIRYETVPFYNITRLEEPPIPSSPPPSSPSSGRDGNNTTRNIIIIVVSIVACLILAVCVAIFVRKRERKRMLRKQKKYPDQNDEISTIESIQYDFGTIRAATDDFSDANKLGQGGFGAVYKGELPNGQEIAVKRLSKNSGQGDLEFKNEVLLVAKLQHRNLVRLLGFSLEGTERLLVYELVQNNSLDRIIFDPTKRSDLSWDMRYKIIMGIAKGLLYLHEDSRLRIIHRDLKTSNVLLDEEMDPKISDFGMARLVVQDETQGSTSRIVGTYGYMAPEYAIHGHFSVKSDVFSFGVLVLEIVSGQRKVSFQNENHSEDLLSYAWRNWREGTIANIIDPILRANSGIQPDMLKCIHIGLLCGQENAVDRPTMASVLLMLSSSSMTLPVPSQPAFFSSISFQETLSPDSYSETSLLQEHNSLRDQESGTSSKSDSAYKSRNDFSI